MAEGKTVGILGSGDVGKQLALGFAKHGHPVLVGSRDPRKLDAWKGSAPSKVATGTFAEAASFGEIVVLATKGEGLEGALDLAGPENFRGKLVLDATNPLDFSRGMPPGLFVGTSDSLAERTQRKLPQAKVVKCFNTVPHVRMVEPHFQEAKPRMLICGNDAAAKQETEALLKELGWPGALDLGGVDAARWMEALIPLWVRCGQAIGAFDHALAVVR